MSSAPATGRNIGHYRVLEKLGEGGMGEVYKARDTRLNRFVAIKVLPPDKVADPERRVRFIHEAQAASALNHPNIITVHDIVSEDGFECIVMEYVEGTTLAEKIARGEMRTPEVLKCAAQIADALGRAHAAGIVHRDLKPSNVMVTRAGLVKVVDFGIAKLTHGGTGEQATTVTEARTAEGKVMGTVGYMSPEQVRGQTVDHRSDIFNFGLILYEMLSGKRAFEGASSMDVLSAIIREPVPELPPSVPGPLRQIVAHCVEKQPEDRFQSAQDIAFAMRALDTTSGWVAVPAPAVTRRRKRVWATAGVLVVALAAVFALGAGWLVRTEPLDLSGYRFAPFATDTEREIRPSWSPDGQSIAYLRRAGRDLQLVVRSLRAPTPTQLTNIDGGLSDATPFWSHDGSQILFVAGWRLWRISMAGGEPALVMPDVTAAALSPDGRTLAAWRATPENGVLTSALWIASPPEAAPRRYEPGALKIPGRLYPAYLQYSPDGASLCISLWSLSGPQMWHFRGREAPTRLFADREFDGAPPFDWMPDSRNMIVSFSRNLWLADVRSESLEQLTAATDSAYDEPSLTADGRRIAFEAASMNQDIVSVPLDGSPVRIVLGSARAEFSGSWSADGERMAFVTDRSGELEMWVRSRRGDWERPIATNADFPGDPTQDIAGTISPDGARVAYSRLGARTQGLWISPASGGAPVRLIAGGEKVYFGVPVWSPGGTTLASAVMKDGDRGIDLLSAGADPSPRFIPLQWVGVPAWSPDGRWIACGTASSGIGIVSSDGNTTRFVPSPVPPAGNGFVIVWSRDSASLYVASSLAWEARLDRVDIATGRSAHIADLGPVDFSTSRIPRIFGNLAPDGKTFLTTVLTLKSDIWILEGFPQPRRWPRFW